MVISGRTRAELDLPDDVDSSFQIIDSDTIPGVRQAFWDASAESSSILAGVQLDDVFEHRRLGPVSVRWILLHLVTETARYAGQAQVLRAAAAALTGAQPAAQDDEPPG